MEADIEACFDEISHSALMDRVRRRVGDKRILALVKAFLKAGILSEDGVQGLRPPARLKAAFSRRCLPTSRCLSSTTTSPRHGANFGKNLWPDRSIVERPSHLPTRALCGRLRGIGGGHPATCRKSAG